MTFAAQIITLYPEMFPGPLGVSLAGRALEQGLWSCDPIQLRDFATDKHKSVDDTPAGGGAGMVLRADVLGAAVDHAREKMAEQIAARAESVEVRAVRSNDPSTGSGRTDLDSAPLIALTPRGKSLTQGRVRELAAGPGVTLICGRFEGFDERIFESRVIEEISIGDFILSGGEIGALLLLDACIRLLPGVMGASSSGDDESFENGLLEYPHYTRPVEWEGRTIPEVLRSGDHAKIAAWRKAQAETDTRSRRPDLWQRYGSAAGQSPSGAQERNKDQDHEPDSDA